MNDKQNKALGIASSGHNLLLLGSAGTGKSYVVKEIAKQLGKAGKTVQITCSTGIACQVYENAITIHKFTGIADGRHGPTEIVELLCNQKKFDSVIGRIKTCDVLISDECSMLSSRTFDTVDKACSIKNPDRAFGGMQVIFVGDFLQLPPVANTNYLDDGSYCFENLTFQLMFPHRVVLDTNIRQHDDELITAINEIFSGKITEKTENYISALARPLKVKSSDTVKLFAKNDLVDDYNRQCLLNLPGNMYEFASIDTGGKSYLSKFTAPRILWLKKGVPVVLLRNLTDKLVNGLQGIVIDIDDQGPKIHFPSLNIVTRIPKVKFTVFSPRLQEDIAVREQYPLKPCYGITIHKSQGMSLSRVEIDCRDIFKPGQLGVALSRATAAEGLRVINFHRRYVMLPAQKVTEFMRSHSQPTFSEDFTCCRENRAEGIEQQDIFDKPSLSCCEPEDIEITGDFTEDTDDFDNVIASISLGEDVCKDYEIPGEFELNLDKMKYKNEITPFQKQHNELITGVDNGNLNMFVKKIFLKFEQFQNNLYVDENEPNAIPEKKLAAFYSAVHHYSTSSEYKLACIQLFENAAFSDVHQSVCYNVLEAIRLFFLKQKASMFQTCERKITQREVTKASKARVRYVAGYCIANLRRKYNKIKYTNMYSSTEEGQYSYESAKCTVQILNVLKEEEHFLQSTTCDPESLIDVIRKQNLTCGLTNVSDCLYEFFVKLTEKSLNLFVNENFVKHGQTLYSACLEEIKADFTLYDLFSHTVVQGLSCVKEEFFSGEHAESENYIHIEGLLQNMVLISSQILVVFNDVVAKYLLVLFAQFRKDVKSALRIEKTLAHRKQIKVSKKTKQKQTRIEQKKSKFPDNTEPTTAEAKESDEQATLSESCDQVPGPSNISEASGNVDDSSEMVLCKECNSDHDNDEWIMCDACDSWIHRLCAGLKHASRWKKYSKVGAKWTCKHCSATDQDSKQSGKRKRLSKD